MSLRCRGVNQQSRRHHNISIYCLTDNRQTVGIRRPTRAPASLDVTPTSRAQSSLGLCQLPSQLTDASPQKVERSEHRCQLSLAFFILVRNPMSSSDRWAHPPLNSVRPTSKNTNGSRFQHFTPKSKKIILRILPREVFTVCLCTSKLK